MPVPRGEVPALLAWAYEAAQRSASGVLAAAGSALQRVLHPGQALDDAVQIVRGADVLLGELLKPPDPQSPFKGEFGPRQRVAWSRPLPLRDIKAVGEPFSAKLNDVLIAALAGALRSYLQGRGARVGRASLRAMVPVSLRPPERRGALGNEFGLVVLDLPIGAANWMARLMAVQSSMNALKHSPEPQAMQWLFDLLGRGPKLLEDQAQRLLGSRASLVLSNVAGPPQTLYLAGAAIARMTFWVPHPGDQLGMGISIMSYRGKATVALLADATLVPDPQAIVDAFEREFARMRANVKAAAGKLARVRRTRATPAATQARRAAKPHRISSSASRPRRTPALAAPAELIGRKAGHDRVPTIARGIHPPPIQPRPSRGVP